MRGNDNREREVAAIGDLSREELIVLWQKTHGCPPPKGINRLLLERSAAWNLQAKKLGRLSGAARAGLRRGSLTHKKPSLSAPQPSNSADVGHLAASAAVPPPQENLHIADRTPAAPPLAMGTRLMREWNGRMHVVDVTEQGILFDGKIYRFLSSVANRITGAHWSGPRFFGL